MRSDSSILTVPVRMTVPSRAITENGDRVRARIWARIKGEGDRVREGERNSGEGSSGEIVHAGPEVAFLRAW